MKSRKIAKFLQVDVNQREALDKEMNLMEDAVEELDTQLESVKTAADDDVEAQMGRLLELSTGHNRNVSAWGSLYNNLDKLAQDVLI